MSPAVVPWLLCVILYRHEPHPVKVCMRVESEQGCIIAMQEWIGEGHRWEIRSKLGPDSIAAGCMPLDERLQ